MYGVFEDGALLGAFETKRAANLYRKALRSNGQRTLLVPGLTVEDLEFLWL